VRLVTVTLPDGKLWVRVTHPHHVDPYDSTWAQQRGGRWNPPGSFATLYLNADVATARRQIVRLLEDTVVAPDDLTGDAYELVGAYLPDAQTAADIVSDGGVAAAGLPPSYPADVDGRGVAHDVCQPIGREAYDEALDGVHYRSAATLDGAGRELAWWPRNRRVIRAAGGRRVPYSRWRDPAVTDDAEALFA
jgi:hypothetical protein